MSKSLPSILYKPSLLLACLLLIACGATSTESGSNSDTDLDGIVDSDDNCLTVVNPQQENLDGDRFGDACDYDRDGDGIFDEDDDFPDNARQYLDLDGDGLGHTEDADNDGDGINDDVDNCPYVANAEQADSNGIDDATGLKGDLGDACELSGLNDTGQDNRGNFSSSINSGCEANGVQNLSNLQDCGYGRDFLARKNLLSAELAKKGAGASGFDFTKLNVNGEPINDPNDATQLSYCVKDNITGLIWEAKKAGDASLINRNVDRFYWFDERTEWNAEVAGTNDAGNLGNSVWYPDTGRHCAGFDADDASTFCNTQAFIKRMNATNEGRGYCGFNDWRLPTLKELMSLVDYGTPDNKNNGKQLAIDEEYFQWTQGRNYWTSTNNARLPANAWTINFSFGASYIAMKNAAWLVRLVRDDVEIVAIDQVGVAGE